MSDTANPQSAIIEVPDSDSAGDNDAAQVNGSSIDTSAKPAQAATTSGQ